MAEEARRHASGLPDLGCSCEPSLYGGVCRAGAGYGSVWWVVVIG